MWGIATMSVHHLSLKDAAVHERHTRAPEGGTFNVVSDGASKSQALGCVVVLADEIGVFATVSMAVAVDGSNARAVEWMAKAPGLLAI